MWADLYPLGNATMKVNVHTCHELAANTSIETRKEDGSYKGYVGGNPIRAPWRSGRTTADLVAESIATALKDAVDKGVISNDDAHVTMKMVQQQLIHENGELRLKIRLEYGERASIMSSEFNFDMFAPIPVEMPVMAIELVSVK